MPWNGAAPSQTFGRTDGTRTGATTWQEADAAGVDIISSAHDTHDQDEADGINACLKKDGGNTATSNLPMGGFRHTNVGAATARTNYASMAQMMDSGVFYVPTVGGSANAITLTTGLSMTAYATGQKFRFKVASDNTGATTVIIDAISIKSVARDPDGTALVSGDLIADAMVEISYDGTNFQLTTPSITAAGADVYARIVKAGSVVAWPHVTVPAGWLECDGSAISRTTYAELFANLGTTYGVGDGSTTFNIPSYKDYFLRGFDASGTDAASRTDRGDGTTGAAVGTKQASDYLAHVHGAGTLATASDGAHTHTLAGYGNNNSGNSPLYNTTDQGNDLQTPTTSSNGAHTHTVTGSTAAMPASGGTETRAKNITVKWIILALPSAAAAGTLGVHGLQYAWNTATSGDPGTGKLLVNNATLASATALNIYETDAYGSGVGGFIATWDDSTSTTKGFIHVVKVGAPGTYAIFSVSGTLTDSGAYDTFTIAHVASAGTLANGDNVSVLFYRSGDAGAAGTDAGVKFTYDSSTTMADPGTGDIRLNNATLSSVTAAAISDLCAESGNPDMSAYILAWDDSTTTALRGTLFIREDGSPQNFVLYDVTGASTDNAGWTQIALTYVAHGGSFANGDALLIAFARSGNTGATGATGATGSAGTAGTDSGIRWNFDSAVTMADPGAGDVRLNNATLASVTAIAVADNCAESGNPDVSTFVLAWDDSTTTTLRGTLIIKKTTAAQNFAIYNVTGASTDNVGWTELAVTHVQSSGSFSNADVVSIAFSRSGNAGAGTGDFVGPASSTDNALVRFDSTTGKLGQNSGVIVDDVNNISGVGTFSSGAITTSATIELGHATDTTVARVSAGVASIEGQNILTAATGQPLDATLTAIAAYNTNGLITQTAADTFAGRTLTGTANQLTVTNGDGVIGNPTISLPSDVLIPTVLTVPNTGLHILDTNATHDLIVAAGSDLTLDRTLTLATGDANRTLTITADSSIGGTAYVSGGTDVIVADGGTGLSSTTAYAVVCGGTTSTAALQSIASVGTSGHVLTSNGAGLLPTFQVAAGGSGFTSIVIQSFTASGTYTPTAGMDYCIVYSTGAGGGGGGADVSAATLYAAGGGGGAGGTCIEYFTAATIGASQTVTIGAAGTAGSATNGTTGGTGGNTTFGALHTATGGAGGVGSGVIAAVGSASAGGTGGVPTGGTVNINGGDGDGGIGVAAFDGAANVPICAIGGTGGSSFYGSGGKGARGVAAGGGISGTAGTTYGSGGGGAVVSYTTGEAGGAGAAGVIIVYEFI